MAKKPYLHLFIDYNQPEDKFKIKTDINTESIPEIITETMRIFLNKSFSSITEEEDHGINIFKIKVRIDLTEDTFRLGVNCSENITFGILAYFLSVWPNENKIEIN